MRANYGEFFGLVAGKKVLLKGAGRRKNCENNLVLPSRTAALGGQNKTLEK